MRGKKFPYQREKINAIVKQIRELRKTGTGPTEKKADALEVEVKKLIKEAFSELDPAVILQWYAEIGRAPCLLNDDNGQWAVTSKGYRPALGTKERINGSMTTFVTKDMWFSRIKPALKYFVDNEE